MDRQTSQSGIGLLGFAVLAVVLALTVGVLGAPVTQRVAEAAETMAQLVR